MNVRLLIASLLLLVPTVAWAAKPAPPREGDVQFELTDKEAKLPEMFRLSAHTFHFEQKFQWTSAKAIEISEVTFPSPVETPHANNNTVHCEYFRPLAPGKHPAVVVLHILGGDFDLSRLFCRQLAQNGVAALFLKMPYYGPRRQPDSPARMISEDPRATVAGLRQAVLDIRRGAAWLVGQDEIDPDRLGIFGISLGGITCALASTAEPRFSRICPMLAGGDMGRIAWESKELAPMRERWLKSGGSREDFYALLKSVDPVTYGDQVRGRKILMLNASHDEVIPRACTDSLWHAFGEPEIVWFDAGHYTAIRFIFAGMERVTRFFGGEVDD